MPNERVFFLNRTDKIGQENGNKVLQLSENWETKSPSEKMANSYKNYS